jgi:putative membrane protein
MMWWHGDLNGWAWLAMSASMIAFWGLLIWGVSAAVRGSRPTLTDHKPAQAPDEILRERFARGDIDADEYEHRRNMLQR